MTGRQVQDIPCPDWVVSDTHFCHGRILELCDRPFQSIAEHDQALIDRWNSLVDPDDWVLHLGDFALGTFQAGQAVKQALAGRICLVLGNHDRTARKMLDMGFDRVVRYGRFEPYAGYTVLCTHKPTDVPKLRARQTDRQVLHGHTHRPSTRLGYVDCGVDNLPNYAPVRLEQVIGQDIRLQEYG